MRVLNGVLTEHECDLLSLVGYGDKVIARKLGLSYQTVKNQLSVTYAKLGVQSRTAALLEAVRRGEIEWPVERD